MKYLTKSVIVLRTALFYLTFACIAATWLIPSVLAYLFLPIKPRNYVILGGFNLLLCWAARLICGIRWQVTGLENFKNLNQPCIILSKHQSTWETFFLPLIMLPQVQVVKRELFMIPFFGWQLKMIDPIAIDRSQKSKSLKQLLSQGKDRLERGMHVLIFPEGTRVKPGLRKEFSKGAAMLATHTKTPVIAVAHNSAEFWPNRGWLKYPGTVKVVISPVFDASSMSAQELNQATESWINEQVDAISATPFSGEYSQERTSGKRF